MPPQIDWITKAVRAAAILTGSYVAGTVLDVQNYNQAVILVDFTIGSLTSLEVKVEFGNGDTRFFQLSNEVVGTLQGVLYLKEYTTTSTGKYRIPIPIADKQMKVSVKGTGTVTSSSCQVDVMLAKNYA